LVDETGVEQAAEVGACGRRGDVSLLAIGAAIAAGMEALLERDHEALGPAALADEVFEVAPSRRRLFDLRQSLSRLGDVA